MWRDIITLLGFVFTLFGLTIATFAWLQITPRHLRELTRDRLIRNLLVWPVVMTVVSITFITLYAIWRTTGWWSYAEAIWMCAFFWLLWSTRRKDMSASLSYLFVFAPLVLLVTSLARVNHALSTSVFDGASRYTRSG